MKFWLAVYLVSLSLLGLGIGFYATKLYEKNISLGFITTLCAIIIPYSLFIFSVYLYGLYNHGHPLQFRW